MLKVPIAHSNALLRMTPRMKEEMRNEIAVFWKLHLKIGPQNKDHANP